MRKSRIMSNRIQRKRIKGWRMPSNTVYVGRPSMWGNPFNWREMKGRVEDPRLWAYNKFIDWITGEDLDTTYYYERLAVVNNIENLYGKNLACWCPLDQPCHADILLRLATKEG